MSKEQKYYFGQEPRFREKPQSVCTVYDASNRNTEAGSRRCRNVSVADRESARCVYVSVLICYLQVAASAG